MLDQKLREILAHPSDGAVAIVTQGADGPHVINSWNSYAWLKDDRLLFPAGRMLQTEENIKTDPKVKLTISSREVAGKTYKGAGFLLCGTARFLKEGPSFETVKARFPWARAVLEITVNFQKQTL